jgi:hypothetical protein
MEFRSSAECRSGHMHLNLRRILLGGVLTSAVVTGSFPAQAALATSQSNATDLTLAGYAGGSGAQGQFVVPTLKCGSTNRSVLVGVSAGNPGEAEATVELECEGGLAVYTGILFWHVEVSGTGFTPAVGDDIKVFASGWDVGIRDETQGTKLRAVGYSTSPLYDASVGILNPDEGSVPNFGVIHFSRVTIDGKSVADSGAIPFDMATSSGVLQVHTSILTSGGGGWREIFKANG